MRSAMHADTLSVPMCCSYDGHQSPDLALTYLGVVNAAIHFTSDVETFAHILGAVEGIPFAAWLPWLFFPPLLWISGI